MSKGNYSDIKPGWLNIARHMQAMTTDNGGYAVVTLKVMVIRNEPLFWFKADVSQIQPMAISGLQLTAPLLGLLATLADDDG